jgi:hypothetical protein
VTRRALRVLAIAIAVLGVTRFGYAHDRSASYSDWRIDGGDARVVVRLDALELTHFPWAQADDLGEKLADSLSDDIRLSAAGQPCAVDDVPRRLESTAAEVIVAWRVHCDRTDALAIDDDWLFDLSPQHLHFATVSRDGGLPVERVLSVNDRTWRLPLASSAAANAASEGTSVAGYVALGIEHIASGYDHLAFLVALLLVAGSLGEVAGIVTGFTVAHSITLGLAALDVLRPDRAPIEALIGLSIALVAAENLWLPDRRSTSPPWIVGGALALLAAGAVAGIGRVPALTLAGLALFAFCYFRLLASVRAPERLRWAIAFLFGLLHGFGFAAALVDAQLPAGRLLRALFGFNIGVEAGQLVVVALFWPLLRLVRTRAEAPLVLELGSIAVLALGVFWFVVRAYS